MSERMRRIVGNRHALSPLEISAWIVSLLLLTVVVRTNQILAQDSFFFVAHHTSPRTLIVLWTVFAAGALLGLMILLFGIRRFASAGVFDAVATSTTYVASVFLLGNSFGWIAGVFAGGAFTLIVRRIVLGKVVLVIAWLTALVPLITITPASANVFADRVVGYREEAERPNVVWILPDRAQYQMLFDSEGEIRPQFPNLRRLQEVSTTYTRGYSTANGTELSVPSMLNGLARIPTDASQIEALQRSPGLVEWLAPEYDVVIDSMLFGDLCTSSECSQARQAGDSGARAVWTLALDVSAVAGNTLTPALASKFPSLDGRWRDFWSDQTPDAASDAGGEEPLRWADTLGQGQRPRFVLWHFMGTHDPYNRDYEGKSLFGFSLPDEMGAWYNVNGSLPSANAERLSRRLYLAGGLDLDRQLGALMDRLEAEGTFDQTMLILNSDHGRAFTHTGDHRIGDDEEMMWNEVAHVPLIVKSPGQTMPERVTETRSTSQIASTILDAVGMSVSGGPAIAPSLSLPLADGPYFVVDLGMEHPQVETFPSTLRVTDSWQEMDLNSVGALLPFAVTDPDLVAGEPIAGGWTRFAPSRVEPLDGESSLQLMAIEDGRKHCPAEASRAVVTMDGVLVSQVVWDETVQKPPDVNRGWAVVPKGPISDYAFLCQRL